jgi:general secretion pathway protein B
MVKKTEADTSGDSPRPKDRPPRKKNTSQSVALKQPTQSVPAPADVKLSGIAWQDERGARRAVINGFLLKEGAVVAGATITDIQADRVRFSSAAGAFEIRLDAVFPSEVKR